MGSPLGSQSSIFRNFIRWNLHMLRTFSLSGEANVLPTLYIFHRLISETSWKKLVLGEEGWDVLSNSRFPNGMLLTLAKKKPGGSTHSHVALTAGQKSDGNIKHSLLNILLASRRDDDDDGQTACKRPH